MDTWAINAAARALPPGQHRPSCIDDAAAFLASGELFQLPDVSPEWREQNGSYAFPTSFPIGLPRNDTVHGKLFRVDRSWQEKPLVILVHGWNAELHYLYVLPRLARALARRGINAALIELPLHLQRRPPRSWPGVHDFISDDLTTMLRATRQAMADFDALARWALGQGCPAVGLWGFSLGAWLAGLYICARSIVSQAILTTPIIEMDRAVRELSFCHPIRAALGSAHIDLSALNLTSLKPQIAPQGIAVCKCEYDSFVPPDTYARLEAAWGLPRIETVDQSHLSVLISRKATQIMVNRVCERFAPFIRPSAQPGSFSVAQG